MSERRQLVPPTIDFAELLAAIGDALHREGCFASGELSLEKRADGTYHLHRWVPSPEAGDMWADDGIVPAIDGHSSADSAAVAFLRHLLGPTWASPVSPIDGIPILGCPIAD